jgi:hypothetical protein
VPGAEFPVRNAIKWRDQPLLILPGLRASDASVVSTALDGFFDCSGKLFYIFERVNFAAV